MAHFHISAKIGALAMLVACSMAQPSVSSSRTFHILRRAGAHELAQPAAEKEVTLTGGRKLPVLNRVTFHGNVHAEKVTAEHWFVMFCLDWWEPCQQLRETYSQHAFGHEQHLNADAVVVPPVRFAEVDCAVDKVLCNEQNVTVYPFIVHYRDGHVVSSWEINSRNLEVQAKRIGKFLTKQTDFVGNQSAAEVSDSSSASAADATAEGPDPVATAFQVIPLALAFVGMGSWAFTLGFDLLEKLEKMRLPEGDKLEKPNPLKETQLQRRLPASWTRQQWSAEL